MNIAKWRKKLKDGSISSKEIVEEKLKRIKELDSSLHSFLTVSSEIALEEAKKLIIYDLLEMTCHHWQEFH